MRKYNYAAEKFSQARANLMMPHPQGESTSIMLAFHECSNGLHGLATEGFDDSARSWIDQLKAFMSTDGLEDPAEQGL